MDERERFRVLVLWLEGDIASAEEQEGIFAIEGEATNAAYSSGMVRGLRLALSYVKRLEGS